MIVRYQQLHKDVRDVVRSIESKGHATYIRALLLKRIPFDQINPELSRLGLAGVNDADYHTYFKHVLVPLLHKHKLFKYYSLYERTKQVEPLSFSETFKTNENERIAFCKLVMYTQTEIFFSTDVKAHYGNHIPVNEQGQPIFEFVKQDGLLDVLLHEKRHVIDGMLAQGYSASMITNHLEEKYDVLISERDVSDYARTFMNTKRQSMEVMIDDLYSERDMLEKQMVQAKTDDLYTIGERAVVISTLKNKLAAIEKQIQHARGAHHAGSFASGVLEYSHIREMFADVTERTYARYLRLDEKTEVNVIQKLAQLTSIMAKSTEKIIQIDTALKDSHTKTINEEMLEVITPTLDRLDEEEKQARQKYMALFAPNDFGHEDEDEVEILGVDEG